MSSLSSNLNIAAPHLNACLPYYRCFMEKKEIERESERERAGEEATKYKRIRCTKVLPASYSRRGESSVL